MNNQPTTFSSINDEEILEGIIEEKSKTLEEDLLQINNLSNLVEYLTEPELCLFLEPLCSKGNSLVLPIANKISNETSDLEFTMTNRVKTPSSMFFRLLTTFFDSKMLYDIIAFRILTEDKDTCKEIYKRLTKAFPIPEQLTYLWNPRMWPISPGVRNSLNNPTEIGYRSLDYHNFFKNSIFEVQSRPFHFEEDNDDNYLIYKDKRFKQFRKLIKNQDSRTLLVTQFINFLRNAKTVLLKPKPKSLFGLCIAYNIYEKHEMMWNDYRIQGNR